MVALAAMIATTLRKLQLPLLLLQLFHVLQDDLFLWFLLLLNHLRLLLLPLLNVLPLYHRRPAIEGPVH